MWPQGLENTGPLQEQPITSGSVKKKGEEKQEYSNLPIGTAKCQCLSDVNKTTCEYLPVPQLDSQRAEALRDSFSLCVQGQLALGPVFCVRSGEGKGKQEPT